jgi:hypothetical protein
MVSGHTKGWYKERVNGRWCAPFFPLPSWERASGGLWPPSLEERRCFASAAAKSVPGEGERHNEGLGPSPALAYARAPSPTTRLRSQALGEREGVTGSPTQFWRSTPRPRH